MVRGADVIQERPLSEKTFIMYEWCHKKSITKEVSYIPCIHFETMDDLVIV